MITYEYKCSACDDEFELQSTPKEFKREVACPKCDKTALRHHRSAPALDTYYPGSTKDNHPVHGI